jgi:hypothetical protein
MPSFGKQFFKKSFEVESEVIGVIWNFILCSTISKATSVV